MLSHTFSIRERRSVFCLAMSHISVLKKGKVCDYFLPSHCCTVLLAQLVIYIHFLLDTLNRANYFYPI